MSIVDDFLEFNRISNTYIISRRDISKKLFKGGTCYLGCNPMNIWKFGPGDLIPIFAYDIPIVRQGDYFYISFPYAKYPNYTSLNIDTQESLLLRSDARRFAIKNSYYRGINNFLYTEQRIPYTDKKTIIIYFGLFVSYKAFTTKASSELNYEDFTIVLDSSITDIAVSSLNSFKTTIFKLMRTKNVNLIYTDNVHQLVFPDSRKLTKILPDNITECTLEEYDAHFDRMKIAIKENFIQPEYFPLIEPGIINSTENVEEETIEDAELVAADTEDFSEVEISDSSLESTGDDEDITSQSEIFTEIGNTLPDGETLITENMVEAIIDQNPEVYENPEAQI